MWQDYTILESPIVQYIRDRKNNKKGILISGIFEDKVCFGWSVCNSLDEFDIDKGFQIAEGRAIGNERMEKYIPYGDIPEVDGPAIEILDIIPYTVMSELTNFMERVNSYYKTNEKSDVIIYLSEIFTI